MNHEKPKTPLIVDFDEAFLTELEKDPQAKFVKPLIARSGKDAQLFIANPDLDLAGVIVNPLLPGKGTEPDGLSVIRFTRSHRLEVPVYALGEVGKKAPEEWFKLGIKGIIEKPTSYTEILKLVAPHALSFDPAVMAGHKNADPLDKEFQVGDHEFVPIVAKDFMSGSVCHFAVYVRTDFGRYIKILNSGDAFDPTRVASYLKKGVVHFYIRKEDQEQYMMYSEKIASKILSNKALPVKLQASQTMNYGQEALKYLSSQGISESRLYHAQNFAENMQTVAAKMAIENEAVAALLNDIDCYDHSVSICMITSLIAHASGIESNSAVQMVGLASLLHDIALPGNPPGLEYQDVGTMTHDQKKIYYAHPRMGAEIMQKVPGTHTTVIQAILLHHERKGKKAFDPEQERPKAISGIAEMIGLADEYLGLIHKLKTDPAINVKAQMEKEVFAGFTIDLIDAFNKVFYPSKRPKSA